MKKKYLEVPFEIKKEDVSDDGSFKGYGSTFGGKPDSYGDVVEKGAFLETISKGGRNGFGIAMLWQHSSNEIPGVWTSLIENSRGLKVEGQLALETRLGHDAHVLMKMEPPAIRGLSIGYDTPKGGSEFDPKTGITTIKRVNLWEISLVTFPANTGAQITGVKSFKDASTPRELDSALREAGLSIDQAKYITSLCKDALVAEKEQGNAGILEVVEQAKKAYTAGSILTLLDEIRKGDNINLKA